MSKKPKKPAETFTGGFSRIPHAVMDSQAFIGLSDRGKSLLFALIRQINGSNNGRLQLTYKWLSQHGWQSNSANRKAIAELIERGLIVSTRLGGLNAGCNWYAVTWLQISSYVGLDISNQTYKQGAWADCKLPPIGRRTPPQKQNTQAGSRTSARPVVGSGEQFTRPVVGSEKTVFDQFTRPVYGHNVSIPYTPREHSKRRVVGKPLKGVIQ
ncbi:hypothetical protein [Nitrosomonas supralitoralis]|uniref:Helix-turn-helix domain-containing protein n=1 Tax=Nitrosomonas supralitoralis TaxID=2116706 RepID=A0A2P7NY28_9PROT|nr:hypothetical protein [Nitrosomonas supralitoralis]PSJ18339.1 hypothetical protein C7H79_02915 [Nitrosomonas supralitoralis]